MLNILIKTMKVKWHLKLSIKQVWIFREKIKEEAAAFLNELDIPFYFHLKENLVLVNYNE